MRSMRLSINDSLLIQGGRKPTARAGTEIAAEHGQEMSTTGPIDLRCNMDHLPGQKERTRRVPFERRLLVGSTLLRPVE